MSSSKRPCTLKILDEVNCCFVGLHPDHLGYLSEEYARFAANYYFNPKFKLGRWDGKIRYFYKTGMTFVNLLDDIIPRVIKLGYKIKVEDSRTIARVRPPDIDENFFGNIIDPRTNEPWKMRDYQIELANTMLDAGNGVAIAGTGAGKTSICAALALAYERAADFRSLIVVPDKNLTEQTRGQYAFFGLDVGEFSGTNKDTAHMHVVSTWQSLQNRPELVQDFQMIIVDECHGLKGNVLTNLLNEYGKAIPYRFGVTGTLPKEESDKMAVIIAVGSVKYNIPAHKLIADGHLAELQIDILQTEVDMREQYQNYISEGDFMDTLGKPRTYIQFMESYLPDWPAEKRFLQHDEKRLEWIAAYIEKKKDEKKGNTLVLVDGIQFGKKLSMLVDGAIFLQGKVAMKDRKKVYDSFKTEDNLVIIATVQIASTGLDIPRIFNMVGIDLGKSFVRIIQSIGRSLRKADDKDRAHFTDICANLKYSKRHIRERIKYYKEARYPHTKKLVDLASIYTYGSDVVQLEQDAHANIR
jgi:superfamily II DNA or RNA helicase